MLGPDRRCSLVSFECIWLFILPCPFTHFRCVLNKGLIYDKVSKNKLLAISSLLLALIFTGYTLVVANFMDQGKDLSSPGFFIASCVVGLIVGLLSNVLWFESLFFH